MKYSCVTWNNFNAHANHKMWAYAFWSINFYGNFNAKQWKESIVKAQSKSWECLNVYERQCCSMSLKHMHGLPDSYALSEVFMNIFPFRTTFYGFLYGVLVVVKKKECVQSNLRKNGKFFLTKAG